MPTATSLLFDVYAQLPVEPVSAEGVHFWTAEGRKILDFYGGHAVACLGFGHPRVVETLARQAKELTFQTNAVPLEVRERAAARLLSFAPEGFARVFFVNSGAEANENALRLAFIGSDRQKVVAVEHGFHGRSSAAAAVSWGARKKWYAFPQTPFDVRFVPRNDAAALASAIDDDTAAVILEPVQGMAGAFELEPRFLKAMREACTATGALLIFDEVQCGVGRTGFSFAAERCDVLPDILTTAKSLAAGFPVGAVVATEAVARRAGRGSLGSTFGGGPMACALIETVIDTIETEKLLENVRTLSERIRSTCRVGPVKHIRGAGFLLGLECDRPAADVRDALLARDILTGTSTDPNGNVVRLMPPLTLEAEHVAALAAALAEI